MARGTEISCALLVLVGLAVSVLPLATGYTDAIPGIDNTWSMTHTAMLLGGGMLVALGVALDYRAEQVETTRVTRLKKDRVGKGKDEVKKVPHIRDAFIIGWSVSAMLLLPIGVAFFYAKINTNFVGLNTSHVLMFGFYLAAIISLPLALYFAKLSVKPETSPSK